MGKSIIKYTDQPLTFRMCNITLDGNDDVRVTMRQVNGRKNLFDPVCLTDVTLVTDGADTIITVMLSQAESGMLEEGVPTLFQINYIPDETGKRGATGEFSFMIKHNQIDEVIAYGDDDVEDVVEEEVGS